MIDVMFINVYSKWGLSYKCVFVKEKCKIILVTPHTNVFYIHIY